MTNHEWNLTHVYPNDDAWFIDLDKAEALNATIQLSPDFINEVDSIKSTLNRFTELSRIVEKLSVYIQLTGDIELFQEFHPLANDASAKMASINYYLSQVEPSLVTADALKPFKYLIASLIAKQTHLVAPESGESINALKHEPVVAFDQISMQFNQDFEANIADYEADFAVILNNRITNNLELAKLHKYDNVRAYYLSELNVPAKAYTNLLDHVQEYCSLAQNYVSQVPYVSHEIPYLTLADAHTIIHSSLEILGEAYGQAVDDIFESGLIRSGIGDAQSLGTYDTPTYITVDWTGDLRSLYELTHEIGHAMNHFLTKQQEPFQYGSNYIFTSEIAAIVHENLLTAYLSAKQPFGIKVSAVLIYSLQNFYEQVYVQTKYSEFEDQIHATATPITAATFTCIMANLTAAYDGISNPTDADIWTEIPHFYTHSYYVFQYATGMLIGTQLVQRILTGALNPADYRNYLAIGESESPTKILNHLGIAIESDSFETAFMHFANDIDTLLTERK